MIGMEKKREFQFIKDCIWQRVQSWSGRLLFKQGRLLAQAIPMYTVSCFRFPKSFVRELNMIITKFWWGNGGDNNLIQ